uniref:Uncharacterized protein n=1 Tax=Oryza nivara TaxID=4536 RepID=A0A0E0HAD5_ORYNI
MQPMLLLPLHARPRSINKFKQVLPQRQEWREHAALNSLRREIESKEEKSRRKEYVVEKPFNASYFIKLSEKFEGGSGVSMGSVDAWGTHVESAPERRGGDWGDRVTAEERRVHLMCVGRSKVGLIGPVIFWWPVQLGNEWNIPF